MSMRAFFYTFYITCEWTPNEINYIILFPKIYIASVVFMNSDTVDMLLIILLWLRILIIVLLNV